MDQNQGSISLWVTPEWNGNDNLRHDFIGDGSNIVLYKTTANMLQFWIKGNVVETSIGSWTAGTTYHVVARWDVDNTLDGVNYSSISVNGTHAFGNTNPTTLTDASINQYIGNRSGLNNADALIEGLTIYRRPLFDGTHGVDVGNGDEIAQIYNAGTGRDPTLVTGSWDVVFALPTNSSTGALTTGTGNAWSHPHSSNLLYTSTTNTGGFMMNGNYAADGWSPYGALATQNGTGSSLNFAGQPAPTGGHDYVKLFGDGSTTIPENAGLTTSAWVKLKHKSHLVYGPSRGQYIIGLMSGDWVASFELSITGSEANDGKVFISPYNGSGWEYVYASGSQAPIWESWHHLVGMRDPQTGTGRVYLDGVEIAEGPLSVFPELTLGGDMFDIGKIYYWEDRYAWGEMNDIRLYSRALTQDEIKSTMYKSTLSEDEMDGLVGWWKMDEGEGQIVGDSSGSGINGTLGASDSVGADDPTWSTDTPVPSISALSTSEKIFAGGYKTTSSAADAGIVSGVTGQAAGQNYVVRALAHSDGTSTPKVVIWDTTNDAEITSLTGTDTSTRTDPDVLLFTFELPTVARNGVGADSTGFEVRLINTEDSGTTYWHQVEVLPNLIDNPSMETGSGDPWVPSGWGNYLNASGASQQEVVNIHSGDSALKANEGWLGAGGVFQTLAGISENDFLATGLFGNFVSGSLRFRNGSTSWHAQGNPSVNSLTISGMGWNHKPVVWRVSNLANPNFFLQGNNNPNAYIDDFYAFKLIPVSLTVTPASLANSTENDDEIRVDGRDTYVAGSGEAVGVGTESGYVSFDYRPRHSAADAVKFAETTDTDAYVLALAGDGDDFVNVYWDSANTLRLSYSMAGSTGTGTWNATGAIAAGTQYNITLEYVGGEDMVLSVGGTPRITLSSIPSTFGTAPNTVYFGSSSGGGMQGDATFANLTFDGDEPEVTITSITPDPPASSTLVISGTVTDATTVAGVEYQVDSIAGSWSACDADDGDFDEAEEVFECSIAALLDGEHTVYVRGTDWLGNITDEEDYAELTFTIDTTAPEVTLVPITPDPTTNTSPILEGTATDALNPVALVEYQIDGTDGAWGPCVADDSSFDAVEEDFTCVIAASLDNGPHTIYVRATDSYGNVTMSGFESDSFTVDTVAPEVVLTPIAPDPTTDNTPTLYGVATDVTGVVVSVEYQVNSIVGSWLACFPDDGDFDEAEEVFYCAIAPELEDGEHTIYVRATDNAGNVSTPVGDTFTIDTTPLTPTPTPTSTPTPTPTNTPIPTPTPTPTNTPTPTPTNTPTPSPTFIPVVTEAPGSGPTPTGPAGGGVGMAVPTPTPSITAEVPPVPTPGPTATPTPTWPFIREDGYDVALQIKNEEGDAINNAKVSMVREDEGVAGLPWFNLIPKTYAAGEVFESRSDGAGEAAFENIPGGTYRVTIAYGGFVGEELVKIFGEERLQRIALTVKESGTSRMIWVGIVILTGSVMWFVGRRGRKQANNPIN